MVYLITCGSCNKQYVGETTQPLHKRNTQHRSCIGSKTKNYLYEHFNNNCSYHDAKIQIIDYVNETSNDIKNDLLIAENYWIEKLGTSFPIGLNDKKKGVGNVSLNASVPYFKGKIKRYKRGRGKCKRTSRPPKNEESIKNDIEMFKNNLNNPNQMYKKLKTYRKRDLDVLYRISKNNFGLIYSICSSFCSETLKINIENENIKRENITFTFNCKMIDKLQLKSVMADTSIIKLLPNTLKELAPMRIFYRYNDPVSLNILNYSTFLKNLSSQEKIRDILDNECNCRDSPFNYAPLQHIITGDLGIVNNPELKNIMKYGCKYREPINLPYNEIKQSLKDSVDSFITCKSKKYRLRELDFNNWKNRVLEIFDNRLNFFNVHCPEMFRPTESIFQKNTVANALKQLKNKYVICRVDKAANNYVFICKKFYTLKLLNELGFDEANLHSVGNETYQPCEEDEESIVERISTHLRDNFEITIDEKDKRLARFFWNPKLHKTPYKARFIAGARHCVTKPLNVLLNSSLKLLKEHFEKYCDAIYNNSGINPFWNIDSSEKFLNKLKSCEVYNLQVYDFTTLYTKLELTEVENMLSEVIDLIFSERNKYICIAKYDQTSFFANRQFNNYYCFDKIKLKEAVKFIISNTYVVFGGAVFLQNKGIPMGGNSSSPIAELTVGKKEYNYIKKLMQEKKFNLAKILSNNCRYVDDLITINYLNFNNIIGDIYPRSLEMERTGNDNKNVNYLDLNIKVGINGPSISIYNKTDDFNFNVVSLTFPQSNIPIDVGYNVFYSQVLRYGKACSNLNNFLIPLRKTFRLLINRGYKYKKLISRIKKCFQKYDDVFRKYSIKDKNTIILNI